MFIQIGDRLVNLAHVRDIRHLIPGDRGAARIQVTFSDGQAVVEHENFDSLEGLVGQVVQAPPGFRVVEVIPPEEGDADRSYAYFAHDVVAFRISPTKDEPVPITTEGELSTRYVIVQPSGECSDFDGRYESVEAWKKQMER